MAQGSNTQLPVPAPVSAPPMRAAEPSVGNIVAGIARDSQRIMAGYVELAKLDVRRELKDAGRAIAYSSLAVAAGAIAVLLALLALAHGLTWATGIPLGGSYAIVAGLMAVVALVLTGMAKQAAGEAEMPQVVEEAKEDLTWIKDNA